MSSGGKNRAGIGACPNRQNSRLEASAFAACGEFDQSGTKLSPRRERAPALGNLMQRHGLRPG